ncbi:MAG: 1-acyl-sn-glycerol-3-phosphate acyltransferase [Saprospiraceae bacterium]|nr:1-acyl-sn-glycerol-3-phosphate acyltransferase [Saprospiraceae bacterium]
MKEKGIRYPTKGYVRLLVFVVFWVFVRYYRIKRNIPAEVRNLKRPYLLLSNHVGLWDPFIIGHLLPRFTHFVSSDAAFRDPVNGFFLPRLGTIPKKKNVRDTQVIRDIIQVLRQGENVGLFPEAVRNWAGSTLPIDRSIAKLIKLVEVPVIVAVSRGMNLFNPRWSRKIRRTKVEVSYRILLDTDQIQTLSVDTIYNRIVSALQHDEVAHQRKHLNPVLSQKRAEHINHTLFVCPECHSIDPFRPSGNQFSCAKCDYTISIDKYCFFEVKSSHKLHFDNIRDWYNWQEAWLSQHIFNIYDQASEEVIFKDENVKLYEAEDDRSMRFIGIAQMILYWDRIVLKLGPGRPDRILTIRELQTINPQVNEQLEIIYPQAFYRVTGIRPGVSGLKWEVAVNALWKKMGQQHKLAPYIKMPECN